MNNEDLMELYTQYYRAKQCFPMDLSAAPQDNASPLNLAKPSPSAVSSKVASLVAAAAQITPSALDLGMISNTNSHLHAGSTGSPSSRSSSFSAGSSGGSPKSNLSVSITSSTGNSHHPHSNLSTAHHNNQHSSPNSASSTGSKLSMLSSAAALLSISGLVPANLGELLKNSLGSDEDMVPMDLVRSTRTATKRARKSSVDDDDDDDEDERKLQIVEDSSDSKHCYNSESDEEIEVDVDEKRIKLEMDEDTVDGEEGDGLTRLPILKSMLSPVESHEEKMGKFSFVLIIEFNRFHFLLARYLVTHLTNLSSGLAYSLPFNYVSLSIA